MLVYWMLTGAPGNTSSMQLKAPENPTRKRLVATLESDYINKGESTQ
jgi:hypothetical protein